MPAPSVKGYMALCVTPRSKVCDEQGVGQWPMWKRFDSIKAIVDQYIDEPYRSFLAMPYHEVDKLKAEELFYWYTPRCDTAYSRMSRTADDHSYYKGLFEDTLSHYQTVVEKLKNNGKAEEANFLQLSLKYAGETEDNIYCGDGRVVVTVWGMRPRQDHKMGESKLCTELVPELETHTVRYDLGTFGSTNSPLILKKTHGTKIYAHQVPQITVKDGYLFKGWNQDPIGAEVTDDLLFSAEYQELPKEEEKPIIKQTHDDVQRDEDIVDEHHKTDISTQTHHVRFLTPDDLVIKELNVDHGTRIMAGYVPQLPVFEGVLCPSWVGDPLNDIINENRDYKAVKPEIQEQTRHTVRFFAPDERLLSQTQVEDGTKLLQTQVPPLPVMNGKICPSWDTNPLTEIIKADRDFKAKPPQEDVVVNEEKTLHVVRFLNPDGSEVMRTQVAHGAHLQPEQIPSLPTVEGKGKVKWSPDPTKQPIKRDTDFVIRKHRTWHWPWTWGQNNRHGFWRWLLYILLFILLVFLILYIMYLNDPCSR